MLGAFVLDSSAFLKQNMAVSLIAYIIGFLCMAGMLSRDVFDIVGTKEVLKGVLMVAGVSLLWPIFGVWFLWEMFDVWRVSNSHQGSKK